MLTPEEIQALAAEAGAQTTYRWETARTTEGITPPVPQLTEIVVYFDHARPAPRAWAALLSSKPTVSLTVNGTRQNHSSGAIDQTLYPEYAALLEDVNAKRKLADMPPIRR